MIHDSLYKINLYLIGINLSSYVLNLSFFFFFFFTSEDCYMIILLSEVASALLIN